MVEEKYWNASIIASDISTVPAEYLYAQFAHETAHFTSDLCREYNNLGGLTQEEENDIPQPDGRFYYMKFDSVEDYANYFGRYIKKYYPKAAAAQTLTDYIHQLKTGEEYAYFGDDEYAYWKGVSDAYREAFV